MSYPSISKSTQLQSPGQSNAFSPIIKSQKPFPQQALVAIALQSSTQEEHSPIAVLHPPTPQHPTLPMQSAGQVTHSLQVKSQKPLGQVTGHAPQSPGQLLQSSPGSQIILLLQAPTMTQNGEPTQSASLQSAKPSQSSSKALKQSSGTPKVTSGLKSSQSSAGKSQTADAGLPYPSPSKSKQTSSQAAKTKPLIKTTLNTKTKKVVSNLNLLNFSFFIFKI